ncbi:hypothetical protein D3C72_1689930 [compost metagenome]
MKPVLSSGIIASEPKKKRVAITIVLKRLCVLHVTARMYQRSQPGSFSAPTIGLRM